jgi:lambda family phage minor tail protein L
MLPLSPEAIAEKNNLASGSVWVALLEIQITPSDILYLCNNNENITWNGQVWTALPFELGQIAENSKNEIPAVTVSVDNVTRDVESRIEAADGAAGIPVIIRVVNTNHLTASTPDLQLDYQVKNVTCDNKKVSFTLGGSQHVKRRFPDRRYMKDFCNCDRYGDIECGVSAATLIAYPTCNRTLVDCRERGNSVRFKGEPGIPLGGLYASV